jgi:hypothetical protein
MKKPQVITRHTLNPTGPSNWATIKWPTGQGANLDRNPGPDTASRAKTATFAPTSNLVSRAIKQANRVCSVSHEVHKGVTVDPMLRRAGLPQTLMSPSVFLS